MNRRCHTLSSTKARKLGRQKELEAEIMFVLARIVNLEYTHSKKIVIRHLQVFGRYDGGHKEFSESGSKDELLANDLKNDQLQSGNDFIPELSDFSEEHGEKERKQPQIDSTSISSGDSDSEIFPTAINNTIASYELVEDGSLEHHDQLECEGSEVFESSHCDLSTSSDDSQGEESVASNSDSDLEWNTIFTTAKMPRFLFLKIVMSLFFKH